MKNSSLDLVSNMSKIGEEKTNLLPKRIFRQLGAFLVYLLGGLILVFILTRMLPGNPLLMNLGEIVSGPQIEYIRALAAEYGFDRSIFSQLFLYFTHFFIGDWGESLTIMRGYPVWELIWDQNMGRSLAILIVGLLFSLPLAIPLGIRAAKHENEAIDKRILTFANILNAIPMIAFLLIIRVVFSQIIPIFPAIGYMSPEYSGIASSNFQLLGCLFSGEIGVVLDILHHLIIPGLAMGMIFNSILIPIVRERTIQKQNDVKQGFIDRSSSILFNYGIIIMNLGLLEVMMNIRGIVSLLILAIASVDYFVITGVFFILLLPVCLTILITNIIGIVRYRDVDVEDWTPDEPMLFNRNSSFIHYKRTKLKGRPVVSALRSSLTIIGIVFITGLFVWAVIASNSFDKAILLGISFDQPFLGPTADHLFGTGKFGRDVYGLVAYGTKNLIIIGFGGALISSLISVPMGYLVARQGSTTRWIINVISNMFLIVPTIMSLILITSIYGSSLSVELISIGILSVFALFQLSRILFQQVIQSFEEVPTAKEIWSEAMPGLISLFFLIGTWIAILSTALGYIGFAAQETFNLGMIIRSHDTHLFANPSSSLFPGLFIFLVCLAFMLINYGFRIRKYGQSEEEPTIL
ncbi:MAG: ABC transporter permease subunit [Promethearchaeota archaeon]